MIVNHNQGKAMEVDDRIVVMNNGKVQQSSYASRITSRKASTFVPD